MTADEKRDRRKARHELQSQVKQALSTRYRLDHSPNQLRTAARIIADRYTKDVLNAEPGIR